MYFMVAVLSACGGKVVVDLGAGSGGSGGSGVGGSGGASVPACPAAPVDGDIQTLVGKPCATEGDTCISNNGCGGCSIQCLAGTWAPIGATLCYSIGNSC
jgi:hypothetical protein